MYIPQRHGGIEPHIFDLQSKCKTFYRMSLMYVINQTRIRFEPITFVSVAQYSNH